MSQSRILITIAQIKAAVALRTVHGQMMAY